MSAAALVVTGILLTLGAFFCVTGAVGLLRLPDVYTRIHAAGITDTLGAGLVVLALLVWAVFGDHGLADAVLHGHDGLGPAIVCAKLISILFFLWVSGTTATHALAKAAWLSGVEPWRRQDAPGDGGGSSTP